MHIFELILFIVIGLLVCYMGWRVWKKEQITLIHSYHYKNVSEANNIYRGQKTGENTTRLEPKERLSRAMACSIIMRTLA